MKCDRRKLDHVVKTKTKKVELFKDTDTEEFDHAVKTNEAWKKKNTEKNDSIAGI